MRGTWKRCVLLLVIIGALVQPLALGNGALAAGTGTLRMTLRGCPDGIDPTTISDSSARRKCDIPLDAPDDAYIYYGGDGQGGEDVRFMDRRYDGTYETRVPANTTINLIGFEPTVRDTFAMTNVSDRDGDGNFDVRVRPNRTHTVRVYYYNLDDSGDPDDPASLANASATLHMTFRACPDHIDPYDVNPWEVCTIPLDAPDASMIVWGGSGVSVPNLPRQWDGTYEYTTPKSVLDLTLTGIAPVVRNAYVIHGVDRQLGYDEWAINLFRDEVREIWIFYYYA